MSDWTDVLLVAGKRPTLPGPRCILRAADVSPTQALLDIAERAFDNGWEAAIPLMSWYGDQVTWDTRLLLVRRCRGAFELLKLWRGDGPLALRTAIYESRVLVMPLAPLEVA